MGDKPLIKFGANDQIREYKLLPSLNGQKIVIIPSFYIEDGNKKYNHDKSRIGLGYLWQDYCINVIGMLIRPEKNGNIIVNKCGAASDLEYALQEPDWKFAIGGGNMSTDEIMDRFGNSLIYIAKDEETKAAIKLLFNAHSEPYFRYVYKDKSTI